MASRPFEDLYIYLVSGTLTESDEIALGDTFIGNCVEGNSAFLFFSTPAEKQVTGLLKSLGYHTLKEWDHDMTWFTTLAEKA